MRIAVLGCGKMAGAIVSRWLDAEVVQSSDVMAIEVSQDRAQSVQSTLGIQCVTNAALAINGCDVLLLGIKPQQAASVLPSIAPLMRPGQAVISILAGTPANRVNTLLGSAVQVVRIMPNTPAKIGLGCTAVAWPDAAEGTVRPQLMPLMQALGDVVELAESRIDAFTSIAGSGPAYVFLFLEALQQAAVKQGFTQEDGRTMALATVLGAATLAHGDDRQFEALRKDVTSPGGTTQAAIGVLMEGHLPSLLHRATARATERAKELAETT